MHRLLLGRGTRKTRAPTGDDRAAALKRSVRIFTFLPGPLRCHSSDTIRSHMRRLLAGGECLNLYLIFKGVCAILIKLLRLGDRCARITAIPAFSGSR